MSPGADNDSSDTIDRIDNEKDWTNKQYSSQSIMLTKYNISFGKVS